MLPFDRHDWIVEREDGKEVRYVIDFYSAGGRVIAEGPRAGDGRTHPGKSPFIRGFTLTAQERQDLLAFLASLTDEKFLSDPQYSAPNTQK